VVVAGEETNESLSAWLRAAAAAADQSSESERGARETDNARGAEEGCSGQKEGERRLGCIDGVRKIAPARAFFWAVFFSQFLWKFLFFLFFSLPFKFFIFVDFIYILFMGHYQWLVQ